MEQLQTLPANERDLRVLLLENVVDYAIYWLWPDGTLGSWNAGARQMTGYEASEVMGRHVSVLYREDERKDGKPEFEMKVAAQRGSIEVEGWRVRKDGSSFWASSVITPLRDPSGNLLGFGRITRDLTSEHEQHFLKSAGELLSSSLDFRKTLQHMAEVAAEYFRCWCSVHVRRDGKIESVAASHPEKALFRLGNEILGRLTIDLQAEAGMGRVIRTGKPERVQSVSENLLRVLARTSEERNAISGLLGNAYVCVPVKAGERTIGAIALVREGRPFEDREVQVLESLAKDAAMSLENVAAYTRARQAIQDRDDVLAIVSHDLKNPVASIIIGTGFLLKTLRGSEVDEGVIKQLEVMYRAAQRMNRMISDFLDLVQMEGGRLMLQMTSCRASTLFSEVLEVFQPIAEEKGITLEGRVSADCVVRCDHDRILQVFFNLLGNAVKFTSAGGSVCLTLKECRDELRFEVSDTGPGIRPEYRECVFERFWKGKPSRTQGAGLGLSIARGIVAAHGGHIWVEDGASGGATFIFTLPAQRAAAPNQFSEPR